MQHFSCYSLLIGVLAIIYNKELQFSLLGLSVVKVWWFFPLDAAEGENQSPLAVEVKVKVLVLSQFLLATTWSVAPQASLSMDFSRQEYWSGQSVPSLGDLPDPGINFQNMECSFHKEGDFCLFCLMFHPDCLNSAWYVVDPQ